MNMFHLFSRHKRDMFSCGTLRHYHKWLIHAKIFEIIILDIPAQE